MKYRTKPVAPVEVEAIQFTPELALEHLMHRRIPGAAMIFGSVSISGSHNPTNPPGKQLIDAWATIRGIGGGVNARLQLGEWILNYGEGDIRHMSDAAFRMFFDPIE